MTVLARPAKYQGIPAYVASLRHLTGYYTGYVSDYVFSDDAAIERIKNDDAVSHAMNVMGNLVAGESWHVPSPIPAYQDLAEQALSNIAQFLQSKKQLAYNGLLYGIGVQRIIWEERELDGYPGMKWKVPVRLKEIDKRRMRLEYERDGRTRAYWTIWERKYDQYMIIEDRSLVPDAEIAVQDFVWYWTESEETAEFGFRGYAEILHKILYIKDKLIHYWARLCEHHSQPWIIAIVNLAKSTITAFLGDDMLTGEQRRKKLLEMLENMRAGHVGILDKEDKLEFKEHGSVGKNVIEDFILYVNSMVNKLILGAELTTVAGSVGSYATGFLHQGVTNAAAVATKVGVDESYTRDLLGGFWWRNWRQLHALGLKVPSCQKARFETIMHQGNEHALEAPRPDQQRKGVLDE